MSARRTTSVGLLQAVDDPRLIGFRAHAAQRDLLALLERNQIVVAAAGDASGRAKAAAAAALHNLLLVPALDGLVARGERRYALSIADSQAQAGIFVEHARALLRESPVLRPLVVRG